MASKNILAAVLVAQTTVGVRHDAEVEEAFTSEHQVKGIWDSNEKQKGSYCCYQKSETKLTEDQPNHLSWWIATSIGLAKSDFSRCEVVAPGACPSFTRENDFTGTGVPDFQGFVKQAEMFDTAIAACKEAASGYAVNKCEEMENTKTGLFTKVKHHVETKRETETAAINNKYSELLVATLQKHDDDFQRESERLQSEHDTKIENFVASQQNALAAHTERENAAFQGEVSAAEGIKNAAMGTAQEDNRREVEEEESKLTAALAEAETAFNNAIQAAESTRAASVSKVQEDQKAAFSEFMAQALKEKNEAFAPEEEKWTLAKATATESNEAELKKEIEAIESFTRNSIEKWTPLEAVDTDLHAAKKAKCLSGADCCCLADLEHTGTWTAFKVPSNFAFGVCSDTSEYKKSSVWQSITFRGVDCDNYFVNCKQCVQDLCDENSHCERQDFALPKAGGD